MTVRSKQVLAVVVGVLVAIGMLLLGLWQMERFQRSMVDIGDQRASLEAVSLADSVAPDGTVDDIYGRLTTLDGSYLPEHQLLVGTEWPMRVVTAFQLDDGRHVAVVRGLTDSPLGEESLPVNISTEGYFTAGDLAGIDPVPSDAPEGSLATVRLQNLVQDWPQPLISGYVTLTDAEAGAFGLPAATAELPEGEGTAMHQGYAMQWWVFAAASIAFSIFVARGFAQTQKKARKAVPAQN